MNEVESIEIVKLSRGDRKDLQSRTMWGLPKIKLFKMNPSVTKIRKDRSEGILKVEKRKRVIKAKEVDKKYKMLIVSKGVNCKTKKTLHRQTMNN